MFEGGKTTALNASVIGKLCDALGLIPPSSAELDRAAEHYAVRTQQGERTFCPNAQCPCNLPVAMGERVVLMPRAHVAAQGEVHCAWCGEVLERHCPECGAPINAGAFCTQCGSPYLTDVPHTVDEQRIAQSERISAWIN